MGKITLKFDSGEHKCECGSSSMVFNVNLRGDIRYQCFECGAEVTDGEMKTALGDALFSPVVNETAWVEFLTGCWQKEAPTAPGTYPTAAQTGERAKDRSLAVLPDKSVRDITSFVQWSGWWWSKPYPKLPKPPNWE